jgi:alkanesulfonate monooxygenase SsuD/methylene tetrahydromethanopterin reductase-like flavin-dependent oxidoreductase (luciferase family)
MPDKLVKSYFDMYREAAAKHGYEASPYQLGHALPIYVAETDARAREEAERHLVWLYKKGLRMPLQMLFPPGYVTHESMKRILGFADQLDYDRMSFDDLNEKGYAVVGSVETVKRRLIEYGHELRFGLVLALLHFGDMPHHRTIKNMEIFASEVMPALRKEFAGWKNAA